MYFRSLLLILAGALITACASDGPEAGEGDNDELTTVGEAGEPGEAGAEYFQTTQEFTPFYELGPQQAGGPDLSLKQGEVVQLVSRGFGFSQVEIEDGRTGYVATDALEKTEPPAPDEPAPAPRSSAITRVYDSGGSSSYSPPPDLPPLPDVSEPVAEEDVPAFRY